VLSCETDYPGAGKRRGSERPAFDIGLVRQLLRAGLEIAPSKHRGKDNGHRDDGYRNEYRIDWHG
jgi:hypothetical protein